jgi:hypothetical protein
VDARARAVAADLRIPASKLLAWRGVQAKFPDNRRHPVNYVEVPPSDLKPFRGNHPAMRLLLHPKSGICGGDRIMVPVAYAGKGPLAYPMAMAGECHMCNSVFWCALDTL